MGRGQPLLPVTIMDIKAVTTTIYGNEKAWAYYEIHEQSPMSRGFHRYRIVEVNRDGNIAEFREDMGLASRWKGVKQLRIPSLWCHSVDELLDLAEFLRNETDIDVSELLELDNYKLV